MYNDNNVTWSSTHDLLNYSLIYYY